MKESGIYKVGKGRRTRGPAAVGGDPSVLKKPIADDEDNIRFYFLGAEDVKRIIRLGDPRTVEEKIFIMH